MVKFSIILVVLLLLQSCSPCFCTHVLFSETQGRVVFRGKPVAGVRVVRWYDSHWYKKRVTEEVITDADGRFYFPPVKYDIWFSVSHEPVIKQKVFIFGSFWGYLAWSLEKHDYQPNGELAGTPLDLLCDLEKNAEQRRWRGVEFAGVCQVASSQH